MQETSSRPHQQQLQLPASQHLHKNRRSDEFSPGPHFSISTLKRVWEAIFGPSSEFPELMTSFQDADADQNPSGCP